MPGDLDQLVQTYIKQLRVAGGIINSDVVIAAAKEVVTVKNRSFLKGYISSLGLSHCSLYRINFVKRKGSTSAKLPPADFEKVKIEYLQKIKQLVLDNGIVLQMVLNWDQTALRLAPFSEWTMHKQGINRISIKGLDDKWEITQRSSLELFISLVTLWWQEPIDFPSGWDIWHTENHLVK